MYSFCRPLDSTAGDSYITGNPPRPLQLRLWSEVYLIYTKFWDVISLSKKTCILNVLQKMDNEGFNVSTNITKN
jgi:hypothetical protein